MARILLVGDSDGFRQLVQPRVVRADWSFALINDPTEALADLASRRVNLIAIAEKVPVEDRQRIQNAAQAKSIPTTVINPLNQAQVEALIAKLKGGSP